MGFQKRFQMPNTGELHKGIRDLLLGKTTDALTMPYDFQTFDLEIQYNQTIETLIQAGNYGWVNSNINTKNFLEKIHKSVNTKAYLIDFGKWIPSKDAISEMIKYGLKPATAKVILSFGAQYPDEQKKNLIVALGSEWQDPGGNLRVPILCFDNGKRELNLNYFEDDWFSDYRFLAIRK
jgi:hypothetical protein